MKKINKIVVLLLLLIILMQNTISLANVVNIGEIKYLERGEQGFYSIQYWNDDDECWYYIIYSRTYYTDNNGEKRIAYCINPDKMGIGWIDDEYEGYDATIEGKLTDERLWRVYKNGYPYVSPEELGVETEDDAYLATKQAAYCIIKGRTEDDVYDYYRAGTTSIDGEDADEISRRGQKVVDAIYDLVNIGYNGTEEMNGVQIEPIGKIKREPNYSNYDSQEYIIKNQKDTIVTIENITNAPEGTYITDEFGNERATFNGGEKFKIMIPRCKIDKDFQIEVDYKSTCKNYSIYYAKSTIEGTQDYLLSAQKYDDEQGKLICLVNAHKSSFEIIKKDADTKEPIEGVTFNVSYENGEEIGNFITDQKGKITLENLSPGKIIIKEIEAGEAYIISESSTMHTIEYDSTYNITIYNKSRRGELEILKVDKDNNEQVLPNVEFELIDKNDKSIARETTDEEGKIIFKNIKIGDYRLRETKALENYNLIEDQNVTIQENQTISITVENEKKKGKIRIVKIDKENNEIRIPNVEFEILDEEENYIETLITDDEGIAESSDLPIGNYKIKETKTDDKYILEDSILEVEVKEGKMEELKVENERKKGKIKIIKISKDDNKLNLKQAGSPIADVKFEIYSEDDILIDTVVTDEDGIAITKELISGKYKIKEIEAGKWYILNEDTYEIELNQNEQIAEITIENEPANPQIEIKKEGPQKASSGEEIKYEFEILNTGNTDIQDFVWYDFLPYERAKITKFSTGTYNQEIIYKIYYKTNKKDDYILLKDNLNSRENNYIDISEINLEEEEKITEIKVEFGDVKKGFNSETKPHMYLKLNQDLIDNTEFINEAILDGYYQEYKLTSEDSVITVVINKKEEEKRLPRTGF